MKFPAIVAVALLATGCATSPKPLQGEFSAVTPDEASASQPQGELVRWGGTIVGNGQGRVGHGRNSW